MTEQRKPKRMVHLPWLEPLPPFRAQLPGENSKEWHEAKCMYHHLACVQQKAEWLLAHPEDLRLNRN